jgi:uncharacterized Fe-S cluster-containing radical SAM superfamily enzyme
MFTSLESNLSTQMIHFKLKYNKLNNFYELLVPFPKSYKNKKLILKNEDFTVQKLRDAFQISKVEETDFICTLINKTKQSKSTKLIFRKSGRSG